MRIERFNILDYLYYRITLFYRKYEGRLSEESNRYSAAIGVALCIVLNVGTVMAFVDYLLGNRGEIGIAYRAVLYAIPVLCIVICIYIYAHVRHDKIFNKYSVQNEKQKERRDQTVVVYALLSVLLLFTMVIGVGGKL